MTNFDFSDNFIAKDGELPIVNKDKLYFLCSDFKVLFICRNLYDIDSYLEVHGNSFIGLNLDIYELDFHDSDLKYKISFFVKEDNNA